MTRIRVADEGGDEMTLYNYNGFNYPNFPVKVFGQLSSVKIRSDDIIITAFLKSGNHWVYKFIRLDNDDVSMFTGFTEFIEEKAYSDLPSPGIPMGTHWVYEIIRLLVAGKLDNDDVNMFAGFIDYIEEKAYSDLPSPRILDTHLRFSNLPNEVQIKKPKLVHLTRNPKDVMVSFYNFIKQIPFYNYNGKWENWLKSALEGKDYGSWFDYTRDWEEVKKTTDIPILTLNYEDLQEDTFREVKRLCDFLDIDRSEEYLRQVCETCAFSNMKKVKTVDPKKPFAKLAYRKGEVGDWRNWFTVAQNEWFDELYQEKMKGYPLKFRYSLN